MSTSRVSWWPPWSSAWASADPLASPCPVDGPWASAGADPPKVLAKESFKIPWYPVLVIYHLEVSC